MAVQNLILQRIAFIANTAEIDTDVILGNSLIQSFIANTAGKKAPKGFAEFEDGSVTPSTSSIYFYVDGFITSTFQSTVQQNIPALQSALPQYTIVTWGITTAFGN
jgi:hypothetical protein